MFETINDGLEVYKKEVRVYLEKMKEALKPEYSRIMPTELMKTFRGAAPTNEIRNIISYMWGMEKVLGLSSEEIQKIQENIKKEFE